MQKQSPLPEKKQKTMKERQFKLVQTLADDISKLLHGPDNCDLQLIVGSTESKKTYWVHSVILQARSPYFSTAFYSHDLQHKGCGFDSWVR